MKLRGRIGGWPRLNLSHGARNEHLTAAAIAQVTRGENLPVDCVVTKAIDRMPPGLSINVETGVPFKQVRFELEEPRGPA